VLCGGNLVITLILHVIYIKLPVEFMDNLREFAKLNAFKKEFSSRIFLFNNCLAKWRLGA